MIIGVIGSRTFKNYPLLDKKLSELPYEIKEIVSGGAIGADRLGIRWARKNKINCKEFLPDHKKYKHAYHHRNRLIAEYCDILIAFWDGRSTGTKYTINYMKSLGKEVIVCKF